MELTILLIILLKIKINTEIIKKEMVVLIPITLIATVRVKNGNMEKAIEVLKEIVPKIKDSEPGCLQYIPHTIKGEENSIIFYEVYTDSDALKQHNKNLGNNMVKLGPLLEPGIDIKICHKII
ncbi:MAG: putative quinol monooxygenase [Promethearchaeota archaeon]